MLRYFNAMRLFCTDIYQNHSIIRFLRFILAIPYQLIAIMTDFIMEDIFLKKRYCVYVGIVRHFTIISAFTIQNDVGKMEEYFAHKGQLPEACADE